MVNQSSPLWSIRFYGISGIDQKYGVCFVPNEYVGIRPI